MLPKMAFSGFTSRYREPKTSEGFEDITSVDFKVSALPRLFHWNIHCVVSHVARLIGSVTPEVAAAMQCTFASPLRR